MRSARLTSLRESLLSLLRLQLDSTDRDILTVLAGHALRLTLGLLSSAMLARALGPAALGAPWEISASAKAPYAMWLAT
jgi:hypothetical protein